MMVSRSISLSPLVVVLCLCVAATAQAEPEQDVPSDETPDETDAADAGAVPESEPVDTEPADTEPPDAIDRIEELEQRIADLEAREAAASEAEAVEQEKEKPPLRAHVQPLAVNLSVFGTIWIDSGYISRKNDINAPLGQQPRQQEDEVHAPYMQGRFVLGAQYYQEFKERNFVLVKAAFIGFVNEFTRSQFEPRMEDVYIMVGQRKWDIQIGRYLAWEVYYRGQGIELFTAEEAGAFGGPPIYWLQVTRGYRDESGQMAGHWFPWGSECQGARRYVGRCDHFFGIEVSSVYGQELRQNNLGIRPAIDFQYHGFQLMTGMEYLNRFPQRSTDNTRSEFIGVAGRAQYAMDVVSLGAEASWSKQDFINANDQVDVAQTFKPWMSVGGYANFRAGIHWPGIGLHWTSEKNSDFTRVDPPLIPQREQRTQYQGYASYLIKLPVKGLALKFVYGAC
jgi:hypothetical protein